MNFYKDLLIRWNFIFTEGYRNNFYQWIGTLCGSYVIDKNKRSICHYETRYTSGWDPIQYCIHHYVSTEWFDQYKLSEDWKLKSRDWLRGVRTDPLTLKTYIKKNIKLVPIGLFVKYNTKFEDHYDLYVKFKCDDIQNFFNNYYDFYKEERVEIPFEIKLGAVPKDQFNIPKLGNLKKFKRYNKFNIAASVEIIKAATH